MDKLDTAYVEYLKAKIPIIDNYLLTLLIEYCNSYGSSFKIKLDNIDEYLKIIKNSKNKTPKINNNKNNNNISESVTLFTPNRTKIIKSHQIRAKNLIEAIIFCTLGWYKEIYDIDELPFPLLNSAQISDSDRLYQIMNIAPGVSLSDFIRDSKPSDEDLLNILKHISFELFKLDMCGFQHGDLHSGNIFINPVNGAITFIDTGFSIIRLPTNDGSIILLKTYHEIYKSLDKLPSNSDMMHLLYNLSTFDLRSVNNSYHNYFINFIQKLNRLCGVGCPGKFSRIHDYTSSSDYTGNELLNNDRFQIITVDAIGEVNLKNRLSNNGPSKKYKANNISKRSLFSNNN